MAMISGTFGEILKNRRGVGDFMREAEEFEARKKQRQMQEQLGNLQIQKAQKEMDAFDVDSLKSLAAEGLFNVNQGKQMSDEQRAAFETMAVLEGQKTKYQADEFGNVKALTQPNTYQQFLMSQADSNVGGGAIDPLDASRNAVMQRNAQGIQNRFGTLPPSSDEYYGGLQVNDVTPEQAEQIISGMGLEKDAALRMPAKDYRALMEGIPDAGPKTQQLAQEEAVKAAAKGIDPEFLLKARKAGLEESEAIKMKKMTEISSDEMLGVINQLIDEDGNLREGVGSAVGGLFGTQGLQSSVVPLTSEQRRVQPIINQLLGKNFLKAYETLKGGGQITEIEGQKATEAMARMAQYQDDEDFARSLVDLRDYVLKVRSAIDGGDKQNEGGINDPLGIR